MLSVKFFESTLFEVFLEKEEHVNIVAEILEEAELPDIEDSSVRSWFEKRRKITLDSKKFEEPTVLGEFELPELVQASQFKNDNLLDLDVLFMALKGDKYQLQKYLLDIKHKEITEGKIIAMEKGFPFFKFAKDYPIQSVEFGNELQYSAKAIEEGAKKKVKKIIILKGSKELYTYAYPAEANLGRFWVFKEETTTNTFKNSLLFMYSMRDRISEDAYYVLRFEAIGDQIIPKTKVLAKGDAIISFSPNGRMIYSLTEVVGRRSKWIKIVQL